MLGQRLRHTQRTVYMAAAPLLRLQHWPIHVAADAVETGENAAAAVVAALSCCACCSLSWSLRLATPAAASAVPAAAGVPPAAGQLLQWQRLLLHHSGFLF